MPETLQLSLSAPRAGEEVVAAVYELTGQRPKSKKEKYIFVHATEDPGVVVGCVAVKKLNWAMSEIRHLYVQEAYRTRGIGRKLIQEALGHVQTPLACSTVDLRNQASLKAFYAHMFIPRELFPNYTTGHTVQLLIKVMPPPRRATTLQ